MWQFGSIRSLFFTFYISDKWMQSSINLCIIIILLERNFPPNSMLLFSFVSEQNCPTNKYCKWALYYEILTFVERAQKKKKYWNTYILTPHTKPLHTPMQQCLHIFNSFYLSINLILEYFIRLFCHVQCPFACGILFAIHRICRHCFGIV